MLQCVTANIVLSDALNIEHVTIELIGDRTFGIVALNKSLF